MIYSRDLNLKSETVEMLVEIFKILIFVSYRYRINAYSRDDYTSSVSDSVHQLLEARVALAMAPCGDACFSAFSEDHDESVCFNSDTVELLLPLINDINPEQFLAGDLMGRLSMLNLVVSRLNKKDNPDKVLIDPFDCIPNDLSTYEQFAIRNFNTTR